MNLFTKITISMFMLMFTFGVVSYFTDSDFGFEEALAWGSGCGSCGEGGGGGGDNDGGGGNQNEPAPICALTIDDNTITRGGSTFLRWEARFAASGSIDNTALTVYQSGATQTGEIKITPSNSRAYVMNLFNNDGGSVTCRVTVTVNEPPVVKTPTCDFFNVKESTVYPKQNITVEWGTTDVTSARLSRIGGAGGAVVAVDGPVTFAAPTAVGTYTYLLTFDGKTSAACRDTVVVKEKPVTPVPTCDFFNVKESTVYPKQNITVEWGTTDVTSARLSRIGGAGGAVVAVDGPVTFAAPTAVGTYTYLLTFDGKTSAACRDTVVVKEKPVTPVPTCDFFNVKESTVYPKQNITVEWGTTDVTSARLSRIGGAGGAVVAVDGPVTFAAPTAVGTYTYLLTFDGKTSAACRDTVVVKEKPVTPVPTCDFFNVKESTVYPKQNITVEWGTTDVTSARLSRIGGAGGAVVAVDGPVTFAAPTAVGTYTYLLTFDGKTSAACRDTVVVKEKPSNTDPITCADNVEFTASDRSLPRGGDDVTLTWSTTGLDSLSINGVNSTKLSDDETVFVGSDKTFTLTAKADGETIQCPIKIDVATGGGGGGGGSSSPRCDLDISDTRIRVGESVTLEWRTWNTDEILLEDDRGNVLVDSDDKDDLDSEITLRPTEDTEFTLTAIDGRKDRECDVEVRVDGENVTISQVRNQFPTVAGISLTQVPYTGFEAGPMLTFIFYVLLAVWGLFVTYLVVVRKGLMNKLSFSGATTDTSDNSSSFIAPEYGSPLVEYTKAASTSAPAPSNLPTAPVVGYAAATQETSEHMLSETELDASMQMTELENRAHMQKTLFSSDAMRYFVKVTPEADHLTALDAMIAKAKGEFPTEDGWLVINLGRLETLMNAFAATNVVTQTTATTGGSLAEAIVTSNIVAAYQLIAHRPMIALADAAAELDGVLRARKGESINLSELLKDESASLSDAQITAAIHALTSALDGTYSSEEDAVKMAIMKAVKEVA